MYLPLRDMRFDVRLIYEQRLCLSIQKRNKLDANTVHTAPGVFRPDGNERHNVGDEAHLEVCAYIVHLPAKAMQMRRWWGIVILPSDRICSFERGHRRDAVVQRTGQVLGALRRASPRTVGRARIASRLGESLRLR